MSGYISEWQMLADARRLSRVCFGGVCYDQYIRAKELRLESKNPIDQRVLAVGGGAANVAQVLRELDPDSSVVLAAPVGDDRDGQALRRHMAERQIAMPWPNVPGGATSYSCVISNGGAGTILVDAGVRRAELPGALAETLIAKAEAVCLVSPGSNEQIPLVTRLAARRGVPVFFGVGSLQVQELGLGGLREALAGPLEMLILNRPEALRITGCTDIREAMTALRGVGAIRHVIVTDGAAGIHGYGMEEGYIDVPVYEDGREIVDDVGAGDAAQGTIVHFLLQGATLEEAMLAGARQGYEACLHFGATTALVGTKILCDHIAHMLTTCG